MSMNAQGRADAIFDVIAAANPRMDMISSSEESQLRTDLRTIFGGDLAYIVANATVVPTQLKNPPGQAVSTPTGPGAVTSTGPITGTGNIS